jgi:hypothetical protein
MKPETHRHAAYPVACEALSAPANSSHHQEYLTIAKLLFGDCEHGVSDLSGSLAVARLAKDGAPNRLISAHCGQRAGGIARGNINVTFDNIEFDSRHRRL